MIKIHKLQNKIKHYEWGSTRILPEFLGLAENGNNDLKKPYAEMWLGTHPLAPSVAQVNGNSVNLKEISGELPFLLKLIAVEKPLSIQVHPNKEQARQGFKRENEMGLDMDSPVRNYKDENGKNEIICAITPFTLMAGFKEPKEIYASLGAVSDDKTDLIKKLNSLYPQDPGVFSPLYLNLITLQPGQGLFIPCGVPHAYINGFGVELMANSDNVIRGGLTPKHKDIGELKKIMPLVPFVPQVITPSRDTQVCYPLPGENFSLFYIHGHGSASFNESGVGVFIVTEGELEIENQFFKKGESFYFSADNDSPLLLKGNFSLFAACITGAE
ncbi:type I phosphomannose isomerase catalytic subunit [Treponema sp. R80B11-R83G3]